MNKLYVAGIAFLLSFTGCISNLNDDNNEDTANDDDNDSGEETSQDWDFFYLDEPELQVVRNDTTNFAVGVANFGKFSQNFTVGGQDFGFPGLSATQMRIFNL